MRHHFKINRSMLLLSLVILSISSSAQPESSNPSLVEINLGIPITLKEWYENQSGLTGDDEVFGAYVTLTIENELYIGLASARPGQNIGDGAYFAKFDGIQISGNGHFDEQGIHEMIWDGKVIHVAGTDPHDVITVGNDWSTGNHYHYSLDNYTLTKFRDPVNGLVFVFHSWGLWKDGDILYAAVSSHDGSYPLNCTSGVTCKGKIFSSNDNGITWELKSDLGGYRAYDIIGNGGGFYAIHNDKRTGPLSLSKSSDGGGSWITFPELTDNVHRSHMVRQSGQIIAASFDRTSIYAIDRSNNVRVHPLPSGFFLGTSYSDSPAFPDFKLLVAAGGYLYIIAEDQSTDERVILRTFNLESWQEITRTSEKLISLSYWEENNWLVTSSIGVNAKLWRLDLNNLAPLVFMPMISK